MKQNKKPIITLTGEKGETLDFYIEAEIEYDGFAYLIMKPVNDSMGLDPDEAVVFRLEGENIELEFDTEVIDAVSRIYNDFE